MLICRQKMNMHLLRLCRTTTISALKLYEMKALHESTDPTYTSVNLSIFAISEVFVGAFTACLPPLRKTFENVLHKVLPASITGMSSKGSRQSYALQGGDGHLSAKATTSKHECDNESERGMLPEDDGSTRKGSDHAITKTTQVTVTNDDKSTKSQHQQGDWV
jgi:hypothetical protein